MIRVLTVCVLVATCTAQVLRGGVAPNEPEPEPYAFTYAASTDDGSVATREETGTKDGVVTGFYTISLPDGQSRKVEYIADRDGFRVKINTNEVGTESRNPADVEMYAQPIEGLAPLAPIVRPTPTPAPYRPSPPPVTPPPYRPAPVPATPPPTPRPRPRPTPPQPPRGRTVIGDDGIEYVVVPVRRGETLREAVEHLPSPSDASPVKL